MPAEPGAAQPQFVEYVRALRRRKLWIIAGLVVGIAGAGAYSYTEAKAYTATATLLVSATATANQSQGQVTPQALETDAQLFQTDQIRRAARTIIGGRTALPTVTATTSLTDDLITVSTTAASPRFAARAANAYAQAFVANRKDAALATGQAAATLIQSQINGITSEIHALQAQIPSPAVSPTQQSQAATLGAEISNYQVTLSTLSGERVQALIDSQLASGGVSVASNASPSSTPSSPKPKRDMLLGGLAGIILGLGVALGADAIDDRIRSRDDLDRGFPHLPILGFVPFIDNWKVARRPYLVSLAMPLSPAAEAFRSVRTALQFINVDNPLKVILVTSSNPAEGKTATVANLGVGMAKAGRSVCMVSADLRRPRLGTFFDVPEEPGLTSVALGEITLERALRQVEPVPGLWVLGTGPTPVEASEFLGSRRASEVFAELRERFDVVLVDTPPLLAVADSLVLTAIADGVVLVVRQGGTRRRSLARVRELLLQSDADVLGAVLSEATPGAFEQYGDGYGAYRAYYGRSTDGRGKATAGHRASRSARSVEESPASGPTATDSGADSDASARP